MKRITLLFLILLFVQLGISASANNTYTTLENDTYDAVNPPKDSKLIGEFTGGNLSQAFLATNETGKWKNRTIYGIQDISGSSPVNASFNWTNKKGIVQSTTVGWKVWANTTQGNYLSTNISTFQIIEYPVIEKIVLVDTGYGESTRLKARVTDLVGRADVNNVTFKVNKPTGETYRLSGTRGKKINESGREGYIWAANFTQTASQGIYTVKVIAEDETMSTTKTSRFEVTAPLFPTVKGFSLNPLSLGGESIGSGITGVVKQEQVLIGVGSLLGLSFLVVALAYLGRGYEKEEFKEVPQRTGGTNKL